MLGLVKTKSQPGLDLLEVKKPKLLPGEVLVKVKAAGICGSDIHIFDWSPSYKWMERYLPLIPGHEFSGIIEKKDRQIQSLQEGDRVVCLPGIGCGKCSLCQRGLIAICPENRAVGLHRNGAFAEYVALPAESCTVIDENVSFDIAALTEPLTVSKHAVERAGLLKGDKVAVLGCGMIGLGVAFFATIENANVWVFGKNNDQGKFPAARVLGVKACINIDQKDMLKSSKEITNDDGFDVVFETSGAIEAANNAFSIARIGGKVVALGIYSKNIEFDLTAMVRQEKDLITSYGYTKQAWEKVTSMLSEYSSVLQNLISATFTLEDWRKAFDFAKTQTGIKVIIHP